VFGTEGPYKIDLHLKDRGDAVYKAECYRCHGGPDGAGGWTWDKALGAAVTPKFGEVVPLKVIGTDPERVQFRHSKVIPRRVADRFGKTFRKDHPLEFPETDLQVKEGYYAGPISGAFLRAPYLHNASILTLAELIGLEKRRDRFYRGCNVYDPGRVGWQSPGVDLPTNADGTTPPKPLDCNHYFLFDTHVRGNSNAGHAYPRWGFRPDKPLTDDEMKRLQSLLEYLKTL